MNIKKISNLRNEINNRIETEIESGNKGVFDNSFVEWFLQKEKELESLYNGN